MIRQAISPRLAIKIFLNIRDAPQRPWSNRALLFRGHRAGSITGSGVGKAQSTVDHCTVSGRFCNKSAAHNLLYSSDSTSGFLFPERLAEASMSVSHERVPYQQWPSNLARFTATSVDTSVTEAFNVLLLASRFAIGRRAQDRAPE